MNQQKYAFKKNYIFDFLWNLGRYRNRWVKSSLMGDHGPNLPVLWCSIMQGKACKHATKELVKQAEESIAKEKQVTYPELTWPLYLFNFI